MKFARWLLPLVTLALVLLLTLRNTDGARLGPGPLHPAHAALLELDGGARCEACHEAGAGLAVTGCTNCHTAIAAQLAGPRGLHGALSAAQQQRCESCHSEHHGAAAPLIAGHAFALAGYPDGAYDHAHVDFRLVGAHAHVACARCHIDAEATAPPAGGRFLGITQACTECHDDVHRGAFGGDCESCHGQERSFASAPGFGHAAFPLDGAHREVQCAQCHADGSEHAVAALQRAPQPARACAACHADPHGDRRSDPDASANGAAANDVARTGAAAAAALRLERTGDCARCHDATAWAAARPTAEEHAALGFPLRGPHAAAGCADCHGDAAHAVRWRGAAPTVAACAACHAEHPHRAEWVADLAAATGPANGCAGCHRDADPSWRGATLEARQHAATGFALDVPHAGLACDRCHAGSTWTDRFPGRAAADCRACHADVHRGQFDHADRFAQCTACHDAAAAQFVPHAFGVRDHAATAFPLTGAHDAVACGACHRQLDDGVRRFHGTTSRCADCHADVHGGAFDGAGRPQAVDGRAGCARCHDTAAFAPVAATFDHEVWTGHALRFAHAALACTACHAPAPGGADGRRLGKAAGTTCAACHTDPHAGQFRDGGATDCARCHGERDWRELRFDHQRTRFPLDGRHRDLACASCHRSYATAAGAVVRYRPLGTACGDCHRLGGDGEVVR